MTPRTAFLASLVVAVFAATLVAFHAAGGAILERQKEAILKEKVGAGRLLAAHLSGAAVFPLLAEDSIALGTLTRKPPGGGNILFDYADINATSSTDPNALALQFGLIDNIRVTNYSSVVSVTATAPNASEAGPTAGTFTLTRNSSGSPLTVNFTLTGTADIENFGFYKYEVQRPGDPI